MASQVYKTLSKIFGIILILGGIGALSGGLYADSFIKAQLGEQNITLPSVESIEGQLAGGAIEQADADRLRTVAGEDVTTGKHAEIFANNYIQAHMRSAVSKAGFDPDTTTFATLGEVIKEKEEELAAEVTSLHSLRNDTLLKGNTLRGMLLSAYGWGMLGTIAKYAGIALIIAGIALTAFGFVPAKRKDEAVA